MSGVPIGNVQRQTPNSQLSMGVTERAHGGLDMGTDTGFGRSNVWPGGPDQAPAGRTMLPGHPDMGTGMEFGRAGRAVGAAPCCEASEQV